MKQIGSLLILLLFLSSNLYSQILEEIEVQIASRNKLKTKVRYDHKYTNGKPSQKGIKTSLTTYHKSGNILEVNYLNAKGVVTSSEKYDYDKSGNRILYERVGSSKYRKVSKYNSANQLIRESGFNGTEEFRTDYEYNAAGRIGVISNIQGGRVLKKMVYKYIGNIANVSVYSMGSTLSAKLKMMYDLRSNLVEEITLDVNGNEIEKKEYTYNNASQLLEETKTTQGKLYYRITYDYDSSGRLLTVSEERPSRKKYIKKKYSYDNQGNLTSYQWRRKPGEEFNKKTYTYNSAGVCLTEHTIYPATQYELLSKFEYTYY